MMKHPVQDRPIGMFDSGLGGLTVMQQLVKVLSNENIVYFGDTARLPYGGKSPETIVRYSIENTVFLIQKNVKVVVVACNTAAAHALDHLQQIFNIPIISVIEPGAEAAVNATKHGRIGVLGTKGTISSQSYQKAILQKNPRASVFPVACPLFVPLVEEGCIDHPAARLIVQEYLAPLKEQRIDTLLLGCTHYPLLESLIRTEIGENIVIVNSASACAQRVSELLVKDDLKRQTRGSSFHQYFVSDDPAKFRQLGEAFLGKPLSDVELSLER